MYQLEEKIWFWAFIIVPLMLVVFLWTFLWKKRTQKSFGSTIVLKRLSPNVSFFKSVLKLIVLCLAVSFLVIGLINPKIGTKLETIIREGVDIVFDIGAHKGETISYFNKYFTVNKIYAFEPSPSNFEIL